MTILRIATTQMACSWNTEKNVACAQGLVRAAAAQGAHIVALQELFETPYFCVDENAEHFALARPLDENSTLQKMSSLAAELGVVTAVSVFERAENAYFNTLVVIDADGRMLGSYRKSHIPHGKGYSEKFDTNPGESSYRAWDTRYARIGVLICWDQWFPEPARILALKGAEVLIYPTAIGSCPTDEDPHATDTIARKPWQNAMRGHAAANIVPVVAANRIGVESGRTCSVRFFGSSFIADHTGELIAEAGEESEEVLVRELDLDAIRKHRIFWGIYRDRRPDLYKELLSLDGGRLHAGADPPEQRRRRMRDGD